ncbi:MAG: glycosyltransferase family 4 protein [Candidatus Cloacimonetes bacterium]|nr:glycosyltransferase family 4 protein [Candidatus Cloacimonadota bacterium]
MKNAVVLVWNNFTNDKRVMNISTSLCDLDYDVTVIAAKTIKELPTIEKREYSVYRISLFSALLGSKKTQYQSNAKGRSNDLTFYQKVVRNNKIKLILVESINVIIFFHRALWFMLRYKPSLIYCNDLDTLFVGFVAAKLTSSLIIYDSHEIFLDGSRYSKATFFRRRWWKFLEKYTINRVDQVIVTTDYRKKLLQKTYNLRNIEVIRNCHNRMEYSKKNLLREEFGIKDDVPILLYQGGLTEERGIFTMVDIMANLHGVALVFMGMGRDKNRLQQYVIKKGMHKHIFIKDAVDPMKLIDYTSSADIGLQLLKNINMNHYSTISNKIFEYMSAGLAIVASDFPEIRKIVKGYNIGEVVNPDSQKETHSAIVKIVNNKKLMEEMKKNSLLAAKENTWEKEQEKLDSVLQRITT